MNLKTIASFALAALLISPVMAADEAKEKGKKGKGNRGASPATQLIKALEVVGLTDEQKTKIKEMGKEAGEMTKKLREEGGITNELMKKRSEAQKAVRESGVKGKEMQAAIAEKAGLTEAQVAAFTKLTAARTNFQKAAMALLTDEQKAKVPEKMQRLLKGGNEKGKGKKKKKKDAA
jgi:Spy/CpxP family protein refolding chaperone